MRLVRFSWMLHVSFLLFALTIVYLPFFLHARQTPQHTTYSYWHGELADYYQYLSYIHQGRTEWQLTGTYTTEELPRTYIHVWYIILGKVAVLTGLSDIVIYHVSTAISIVASYILTWKIVQFLLPTGYRWIALSLIYLSSPPPPMNIPVINVALGTGNWTKMDSYSRLAQVPHHAIALALMIGCAYYTLLCLKRKNTRAQIAGCFCLALSIFLFPIPGFVFLVAFFLFFSIGVMRGQYRIENGAALLITGVLAIGYSLYHLRLAGIGPWEYAYFGPERWPYLFSIFLSSYGILGVLFLLSLFSLTLQLCREQLFIITLSLLPICFYLFSIWGILPVNKIRFMYTNPYVFLGIGATIGIRAFWSHCQSSTARRIIGGALFCLVGGSSLMGIHAYWLPRLSAYPFAYHNVYIPDKYLQLTTYLEISTPPFSRLLAPYEVAMMIPAFTNTRVFAGHPYAFVTEPSRQRILGDFYAATMSQDAVAHMLEQHDLGYVLWKTTALPKQYEPLLTQAGAWGDVILYKTIHDP